MIDRQELIEVLRAVERRLKDGETLTVKRGVLAPYESSPWLPKSRVNVKAIRVALEFGEEVSE